MEQFSRTVIIHASAGKVWHMLTDPVLMSSWMGDPKMNIEVLTNWEINSPVIVRGSHHGDFENTGIVLQYEPEKKLSYTHLSSVSRLADEPKNYSVFEFELDEQGDNTQLTITVKNFPTEVIRKHLEFFWGVTLMVIKGRMERLDHAE